MCISKRHGNIKNINNIGHNTLISHIMPRFNAFSFFLKLSVLSLLAYILPNSVTFNRYIVGGQILEPIQFGDAANQFQYCDIEDRNNSEEEIAVIGSAQQVCNLNVNISLGSYIRIDLSGGSISNERFLLYVERESNLVDCFNKYVVVKRQIEACQVTFSQEILRFHFQGNVSFKIKGIPSFGSPPECPELTNSRSDSQVNQIPDCKYVKGYKNQITCEPNIEGPLCSIRFPWASCSAILGRREVLFQCFNDTHESHNQESMLFYPTNTTYLGLNNNNIETLAVSSFSFGLEDLLDLYLHENVLTSLETGVFIGLPNLSVLLLYGNRLVELGEGIFQGLGKLTRIDLDDNMLSTVPVGLFTGLYNLNTLHLYDNLLTALESRIFQDLGRLEKLHLYANRLTTLPAGLCQRLDNLKILTVYNNQLVMLDGAFEGLRGLYQMELDVNNLEMLPQALFFGMENLETLSLYQNQLVTLTKHVFQGLSGLQYLFLHINKVKTIQVGTFEGLVSLKEMYLSDNQLATLNPNIFQPLNNLTSLGIDVNKLVSLPDGVFNGLDNLAFLFLETNQLMRLGANVFDGLNKLHFLYLYSNNLTDLSEVLFKETTNITFLELSKNKLSDCPNIEYMTNLNYLNLRNNTLREVTRGSFSTLPRGSELNVNQQEICECYVSDSVNCSAANNRSPYLTCGRLLSDRTLVVAMWLIGINALCGNVFVLVWRKKNTQKNKVQDLLLSNLAMSDSLMGIYMIIIALADFYYGIFFPMNSESWRSGIICRIAGALSITSSEASVFFVTMISIDRFIGMRFPLSTNKLGKQSTIAVSALIWISSLILGIAPSALAGKNFKFYDNSHVCIGLPLALTESYSLEMNTTVFVLDDAYFYYIKDTFKTDFTGLITGLYFSTALFLGLNCLCYLIILGCYIEIVRAVRRSSKLSGRTREMKEEIRLTTKVSAIVATDFMCWFPIIILGILVQARVIKLPPSVYAWSITFVLPLNSAINPYLYTISEIITTYSKNKNKERRSKQPISTGKSTAVTTVT